MPHLVDPLLAKHASPRELYSEYSGSTLETAKAIKALTKFMQEPASQDMLKKAKDSRAADGDGIQPWMVTDHVDWLEVRDSAPAVDAARQDNSRLEEEEVSFPSRHEIPPALAKFKSGHPGLEFKDLDSDKGNFEVTKSPLCASFRSNAIQIYLPPPARIHFQVEPDFSNSAFIVNTTEKGKLQSSIMDCVMSRPNPDSIDDLLVCLPSRRFPSWILTHSRE